MINKLPKILAITFITFFVMQVFCLLFFIFPAAPARADVNASTPNWKMPDLQIDIGGLKGNFTAPTQCNTDKEGRPIYCVKWISQYVAAIYKYAIGIVGILAAIVLMIGGIIWLTAGGSATRVGEAKAWIGASLTGLLIALCSYMILYQINPALVNFGPTKVTMVPKTEIPSLSQTIGCCEKSFVVFGENCSNELQKNCDTSVSGIKGWYANKTCKEDKCVDKPPVAEEILISGQPATQELANIVNCIKSKITTTNPTITSVTDSNVGNDKAKIQACCSASCSSCLSGCPCKHTCGSCHYGCNSNNRSNAVDYGGNDAALCDVIYAANKCGATNILGPGRTNFKCECVDSPCPYTKRSDHNDHIHISTSSCGVGY